MPTLLDLLYVALFAIVLPLLDYLVVWPALQRKIDADPIRAKNRFWVFVIVSSWIVVAAGATLWISNNRFWADIGFNIPEGWRLWVAIALVLLVVAYIFQAAGAVARDPEVRATVRGQMTGKTADLLPNTKREVVLFCGVSLTAGFCEEFLFRGYIIWALAPWLGWWGAAALSLIIFAGAHAYQGWNGVLRTGIVGLLYTLIVAMSESLWPAIILHFLWDFGMGIIAWLALREDSAIHSDIKTK